MIAVNTQNILFIAGGAFNGIDKKIASRLRATTIGYKSSDNEIDIDRNNLLQYIAPPDLRSFGLIPELVGRFPVVCNLNELDKEALRRILIEPQNAIIKQYTKLFELDKVKLEFSDEALDLIVEKAIDFKLGARGLRSIVESILNSLMFELPSQPNKKQFTISRDYAEQQFNSSGLARLKSA
jgi:ATP-dependent Clp protease ATP-binding subunit ClpX